MLLDIHKHVKQEIQLTIQRERLVAIVGPTSSGKTDLSIVISERYSGEVINADSKLFYKGLDIGTAKPTEKITKRVRHHMLDCVDPTENFNISNFLEDCRLIITQLNKNDKLPVVTGGSGQYIWALLDGWNLPNIPPDHRLRRNLEMKLKHKGTEALFLILQSLDANAANSVDPKNHRRIIRAIERTKAKPYVPTTKTIDPYDQILIGLHVDRSVLHERVRTRIKNMLGAGWLDEVAALLNQEIPLDNSAMASIGYRDMANHLRGLQTLDEAVEKTVIATNRLIRHQNNWFKKSDHRIKWFDVTNSDFTAVLQYLDRHAQNVLKRLKIPDK